MLPLFTFLTRQILSSVWDDFLSYPEPWIRMPIHNSIEPIPSAPMARTIAAANTTLQALM
jgi:hypothetical protein